MTELKESAKLAARGTVTVIQEKGKRYWLFLLFYDILMFTFISYILHHCIMIKLFFIKNKLICFSVIEVRIDLRTKKFKIKK